MRRIAAITIVALLGVLAAAPAAPAASRLVIKGRGYGHGIGLSQYGALGYAQHGFTHTQIIDRYYQQTTVAPLGSAPDVRVLLQSGRRVVVTGAAAAGTRRLTPARTYSARPTADGRIALYSPTGRRMGTYDAPLRVASPAEGAVQLKGPAQNGLRDGRYRGALEIRHTGAGVQAVNVVGLEDYLRGVISAESPAGWPAEALKAQAVVARSYAVTTNVGTPTDGIDQYADTRSQMYRGVAAEFPSTDAAVAATAGQVVVQDGKPVTTYFFSTSGGHTENVEFSFIGAQPRPWLKGVEDPFDSISPKHTWGPITLTAAQATAKLKGLVRGTFRGITVLQRGESPRIVRAEVAGTGGVTPVTGPELRRRLGLDDTWATFTFITSTAEKDQRAAAETDATEDAGTDAATGGTTPGDAPPAAAADPTGGQPALAASRAGPTVLTGTVSRAPAGARLRLQVRRGGVWFTVGRARVGATGRYRARVPEPGRYRVVWGDAPGPAVAVR